MKVSHKESMILSLFIGLLETSLRGKHFKHTVLRWVLYGTEEINFHSEAVCLSFTGGHVNDDLRIQFKEISSAQGENSKNNPSRYVKRPLRKKQFNFQRENIISKTSNRD